MSTSLESFYNRLRKIGVETSFIGNYPWIYLDTVNSKKVKGELFGNHGFTVFFSGTKREEKEKITNISLIFKKIRETLKCE